MAPPPQPADRDSNTAPPPPGPPPPPPHPPSRGQLPLHQSDADEEDENVKQLQECSSVYLSLQDCLVNSNRNWKSCQKEVQALKACHERRSKDRSKDC